ncbi:MAG: ABC transporter substrate-binding protein [Oscillospiraceae bacterium]|nr:ABC transporter substrate-binding protein [Oscillospiraceae bacterium]
MKNAKKLLALLLALTMCVGLFAGCGNDAPASTPATSEPASTPAVSEPADEPAEEPAEDNEPDTLVVQTQNFDGKFSPFFYTNDYESQVLGLTHIGLLGTDREGSIVMNGIEGEVRPYNGTDYTYTGIADLVMTENEDGTVWYDITMRDDIVNSDGTPVTIDDVIFTMYVLLDPTFDGISTFYSLPIEGLEAYRSGMESRQALILAAGPEGYEATDYYTEEQYNAFWAAFDAAGPKFAQEIVDYCTAAGYGDDVEDVCTEAAAWGYDLAEGATVEDFWAAIVDNFGYDLSDNGINYETAGTSISTFIANELGDMAGEFQAGVQTGESAPNVSGIQKTGDNSLRVVLTEINANAIYQMGLTICPLHYYGETSLYDYDNNMFGFPKGDLSDVKSVTSIPLGAGPYVFESYENGVVTLAANELYYKGCPKIEYILYKEGQDADKVPGVVAGTVDITDPSYSTETANQIMEANGGAVTGDVITTNMVANLGYGYVGIASKNVCIDTGAGEADWGSEASRNLRKAIATVISVYRDVAVDSYYGEFANVINYPISDTSWAAPRVTDEGYKIAFSTDVNGEPIYTEGMTADEKYEAAKAAALGYFEAAGYTVADGKVTAAPEGGKMDVEVMVGGGGIGDHPTFMALTLASEALKEIGFNFIVTDMSNFAEMTNSVNAGTAEMFAMAWQATVDPDMYQIYHSNGGSNEKSYWIKDAELDELIMMARQSTDQTYRKTLYKECLDIVADWAVEIPVYQRQNCIIFSTERVNMDTVTPDITTFWGWANDIELLEMN